MFNDSAINERFETLWVYTYLQKYTKEIGNLYKVLYKWQSNSGATCVDNVKIILHRYWSQ